MSPYMGSVAAQSSAEDRAAFVRRTYIHLAGALAVFVGVEYIIMTATGLPGQILRVVAGNRYGWLGFLGAFMVAGWLARSLAASGASAIAQYVGLGLYVIAEAVMFAPLLLIAAFYSTPQVIPCAALMTGLLFLGLTFTVLTSRRDFSFLGAFLSIGGWLALGLIVSATVFNFDLGGLLFSGAMVVFASGAILYDTSRIFRTFPTDRHVAAALELFASVALLLWYVLRIFMRISRR